MKEVTKDKMVFINLDDDDLLSTHIPSHLAQLKPSLGENKVA
jgi:hypothetical protein